MNTLNTSGETVGDNNACSRSRSSAVEGAVGTDVAGGDSTSLSHSPARLYAVCVGVVAAVVVVVSMALLTLSSLPVNTADGSAFLFISPADVARLSVALPLSSVAVALSVVYVRRRPSVDDVIARSL